MNREIKFRGFYKGNAVFFTLENIIGNRCGIPCVIVNNDEWVSIHILKNISQFTSLKDRNGKEIYFGDILKVGRDSDNTIVEVRQKNGQIFFNKSPAVWALGCIFGTDHYNECGIPEQLDECEIIGNIFENPELLKK